MTVTTNSQVVFYTVTEVAELLKTTPKTIRSYIALKLLNAHQLPNNGSYRINRSDYDNFITGLKVGK